MASRLYLPSGGTVPTISPGFSLGTGFTPAPIRVDMATTRQGTALTTRACSITGSYSSGLINKGAQQFIGPSMTAQTISGTFSMVLKVSDVDLLDGGIPVTDPPTFYLQIGVANAAGVMQNYLLNGVYFTYTATVGADGQGWNTTLDTRVITAKALTSYTCADGDRLVLTIGRRGDRGNTHNFSFVFGDPSATADHTLVAGQTMVGVPWIEFSQDLFGAGAPAYTGTVALSGSGTLTVSGVAAFPETHAGTLTLAGAGTLAVTGVPFATASGAPTLTGSGTLTVTAAPGMGGALVRAGPGQLTTTGTPATTGTLALSGSGILTVAGGGSQASAGTLTLTGSGALTLTGTPNLTGTRAASGLGVLTVTGVAATGAQGTLALTGAGALAVAGAPALTAAVPLTGPGQLTTTGTPATTGQLALTGSGTLTVTEWTAPVTAPTIRHPALAGTRLPRPSLTGAYLPLPRLESAMNTNWTVGDEIPDLADVCMDGAAPVVIDTADTCTVTIRKPDATVLTRAVARGTEPGSWSMTWESGDISVAGTWTYSVEPVWSGQSRTFGGGTFSVARKLA